MITQKKLYDDCFRGEIIEFLLKRGFLRPKRGILSDKLVKGNRSEEIFLIPEKVVLHNLSSFAYGMMVKIFILGSVYWALNLRNGLYSAKSLGPADNIISYFSHGGKKGKWRKYLNIFTSRSVHVSVMFVFLFSGPNHVYW